MPGSWVIIHYASDGERLYWMRLRGTVNMWSTRATDGVRFERESDADTVAGSLPSPAGISHWHSW